MSTTTDISAILGQFPRIEYQGKRVTSCRMVDIAHGLKAGRAIDLVNELVKPHLDDNGQIRPPALIEGKHFFRVPYAEWSQVPEFQAHLGAGFKPVPSHGGHRGDQIALTARGYLVTARRFRDWKTDAIFDHILDVYFAVTLGELPDDAAVSAELMRRMRDWAGIIERQDEQIRLQSQQIAGLTKDVAGLAKQALPRSGRSGSELLRLHDEIDARWPDCPTNWRTLIRLRIKAHPGIDVWNHKQSRGVLVGRREDVELVFIEAINEMRASYDANLRGKGGGKDQRHFPGMELN